MSRFQRNPYEHELPEDHERLPRDQDGKTITPTQALLLEQLERLKQLQYEQWADRVWSQR